MKLLASLVVLAVVAACSSQPSPRSNLAYSTVKRSIVRGKTNQADVIQLMGSPNIVTKNSHGDEVWTYSKQAYDADSGQIGGGVILFGGSKAFRSSEASSFDLILTFDQNDVVSDYSVVSSRF